NYELGAKIDFNLPRTMLLAQMRDESDVMGRIFAIQQLANSTDSDTVAEIAERLRNDPFHGVRVEAAQALRKIHKEEALEALLEASNQPDARVRQQVMIQIGQFYHPAARDYAVEVIQNEKNPDIIHRALSSLGAYSDDEV